MCTTFLVGGTNKEPVRTPNNLSDRSIKFTKDALNKYEKMMRDPYYIGPTNTNLTTLTTTNGDPYTSVSSYFNASSLLQ